MGGGRLLLIINNSVFSEAFLELYLYLYRNIIFLRVFRVYRLAHCLSTIDIHDAKYVGGVAAQDGAALFLDCPSHIHITGSQFISNEAVNGQGGAVFLSSSTDVLVHGTDFVRNAALEGGALYLVTNAEASVTESSIISNSAYLSGGAAFLSGSVLTLENTLVQENSARDGAGVSSTGAGAQLNALRTTFAGNYASGAGGAGYFNGGSCDY